MWIFWGKRKNSFFAFSLSAKVTAHTSSLSWNKKKIFTFYLYSTFYISKKRATYYLTLSLSREKQRCLIWRKYFLSYFVNKVITILITSLTSDMKNLHCIKPRWVSGIKIRECSVFSSLSSVEDAQNRFLGRPFSSRFITFFKIPSLPISSYNFQEQFLHTEWLMSTKFSEKYSECRCEKQEKKIVRKKFLEPISRWISFYGVWWRQNKCDTVVYFAILGQAVRCINNHNNHSNNNNNVM